MMQRRSREGAWIEIAAAAGGAYAPPGRSREGAWIEIYAVNTRIGRAATVAPARERGLK